MRSAQEAEAVGTKTFRVEQFRNPTLPDEKRRALEAAEAETLDMSVAGVLAAARAQTGLDDFGTADFEERLVKAAANRLKNREFLKRNPQIEDIVIDRPIFIVGLPRSGTTHLENLIAADRRLRYLPVYLGSEAAPAPGEKPGPDGKDPRWLRSSAHWERMRSNKIMEALHEHSPDHACGENELQMPDFSTYQWEWMGDVPGWRDYYLSHDQTPHYAYGRTMLKAIAFQFPNDRRWILKGNQHSEQLPALIGNYPDALIVQTHRDPLAILQSVLTMRGLAVLANQKKPNIEAHVAYWVDRIERMLRAYIRDYRKIPDNRRVDLLFQDILADDIGSAQRVLEAAGLRTTSESTQDLRDYMAHHQRGRAGRVVYDLAGDFNLNLGELRERFRFYTDLFPVRHEVKTNG